MARAVNRMTGWHAVGELTSLLDDILPGSCRTEVLSCDIQSYNFEDPRTRTRTESLGLGASSLQFGLGGGALGPEAELDRTRTRTMPHVQVDTH